MLAVNSAVNTVSNGADNVKGINVDFSRGLDISVLMHNILTVLDNHITCPDKF